MVKVLLVDDDPDVLDALSVAVRFHWRDAEVLEAGGGEEALDLFREHEPDLVVLDLSMPRVTGFDVLARLRRTSEVPVLVVTGRTAEADQLRALELGADDHVAKPFSHMVLLAKMRALLRRARPDRHAGELPCFAVGALALDPARRRAAVGGAELVVTPAEYRLLHHLARHAGRFLTHDALNQAVWGDHWLASATNLKALVSRLRATLGAAGAGLAIENERGLGYRLAAPAGRDPGSGAGRPGTATGAPPRRLGTAEAEGALPDEQHRERRRHGTTAAALLPSHGQNRA